MTLGEKIKKLRNDKGLTQKDLADELHVTFQTVSKWEKDENEPDISTLRELSKIFSCSIDYLLSQADDEEVEDNKVVKEVNEVVPVKEEEPTKTVIIHEREAHVCEICKKDIKEEDLDVDQVLVHHAGKGRSAVYRTAYYHKECLKNKKQAEAKERARIRKIQASSAEKKCWGWSIPFGILVLVITLISMILSPNFSVGAAIGFAVLFGYGIFSMIYCILSGSYIGEVFLWAAQLSIKFPGIIFSWDLDGFAFLIAMKILFAVLGFLIGVFALLFAIALSSFLSIVSFPFVLIHNNRCDYDDSVFF